MRMLLKSLIAINYSRNNIRHSIRLLNNRHFETQIMEKGKRMSSPESSKSSSSGSKNSENSSDTDSKNFRKAIPTLRHNKFINGVQKKKSYIPGTVTLQILGSGANGAPSSVHLFTDHTRYLFNCGEGTQRLSVEHKAKLARLEHIFLTRNTWDMTGGVPGLALTLQDSGVLKLEIHGPPYVKEILESMNRFVVLKSLKLKTNDSTLHRHFEDSILTIKSIPLYKDDNQNSNPVVMYLCKLKSRPGALLLDKCVEFGVTPGPLLGQLKNGNDVQLEDGRIVKAFDVTESPEEPASFLFIDIPDEAYLPALQAQIEFFNNLQSSAPDKISLILHFTPDAILNNHLYKSFMNLFNDKTQHIYVNSTRNLFSGYIATHRIQHKLNLISSRVFPLLGESETDEAAAIMKKTKLIKNETDEKLDDLPINSITSMACFHLRPRRNLDQTLEAKLNPSTYIEEAEKLENFSELLIELKKEYKTDNKLPNKYPIISFLGTGSCIPNKTRNVSAILLQAAEDSYMLLDCGEGTLGQIQRLFGNEKAQQVIRNLKAIYVSHLHADHHIGFIGLLNERRRLKCSNKLILFAPIQLKYWLYFYNEKIEKISQDYKLIGNNEILVDPLNLNEIHPELGIDTIQTCLVRHCPHSYGVSMVIPETSSDNNSIDKDTECKQIKITYSGDTMPCQDLVELGANSTILIHEATMEDDLIEEAQSKTHSTFTQAIEQGRAMKAEHIILTHFSQRYAKLPRMDAMNKLDVKNIAIAFDNMQVTVDDLKSFHLFYPALNALFAEDNTELESKALKREIKLERKRKLLNVN